MKRGTSNKKRGEDDMKEEDNILKKVGTENAFRVPDGYFEHFTSELMSQLPEKEKPAFKVETPTRWTRMKPMLYMAAMFIGAFLIIRVGSWMHKPEADNAQLAGTEAVSDEYIDVALDRSMMDDYSLYVYLTEPNAE